MLDLSAETLELIARARTVDGRSPDEPLVPYRSIRDLLEQQTERLEVKPFLVYLRGRRTADGIILPRVLRRVLQDRNVSVRHRRPPGGPHRHDVV